MISSMLSGKMVSENENSFLYKYGIAFWSKNEIWSSSKKKNSLKDYTSCFSGQVDIYPENYNTALYRKMKDYLSRKYDIGLKVLRN